eukprot:245866-Prorocentrum_minimum.AAC.5
MGGSSFAKSREIAAISHDFGGDFASDPAEGRPLGGWAGTIVRWSALHVFLLLVSLAWFCERGSEQDVVRTRSS